MIEYEIKVGEVFTQEKADELVEYLELKDEKRKANKSFRELVMWIAEYAYYQANPNTKMDVPSVVYEQVEKDLTKFLPPSWNLEGKDNLLEIAWGIIANAGGGNWDLETKDWQEAAERWRDEYFAINPEPNLYENPLNAFEESSTTNLDKSAKKE